MTQAVIARRDGDAFQARIFWLKAAKLLDAQGNIVRVGFESGPRGFDDVWVEFDPRGAPMDQFGQPLRFERFQCKWHTTSGTYTYIDLTRPEYINATTKSLLQRAHGAFTVDRAANVRSRIRLLTNHRVDPTDTLHRLIKARSHTLRIDDLFAGKTARSAVGKMRKLWRDHLSVNDVELKEICSVLGFSFTAESLDDLRERMDEAFFYYGLRRIDMNGSATVYDDTAFQWAGQGRLEFDRVSFHAACKQEGLLEGQAKHSVLFGVKSFEHAFDVLEDRCERVLDLVPEFDDRFIRDATAWRTTLQPALRSYLSSVAASGEPKVRLAVDVHTTLAFAAGAVLNTKSGRVVEIEQRTPDRKVWTADDEPQSSDWPMWEFSTHDLHVEGNGIAVAVGLTHNVEPKVREHVRANLSGIRQLLDAKPAGGASQRSVRCGRHADLLAESLVARVKLERERRPGSLSERLHLYIAGPNGFTFFLGRHVQSLIPVTVYEFDFESERDGSYHESMSFPEAMTPELSDASP